MVRPEAINKSSNLKICVIGDQDTVVGFLLAGVGLREPSGKTNFIIVDRKTKRSTIEDTFKDFSQRRDTGIILINQHIANEIRNLVDMHDKIIPTILEIPSKESPYDAKKDSVMQRVKVFFGGVLPE